jgi:cupin fold WbuC family metalloprotein
MKIIDRQTLDALAVQASASPRGRAHLTVHSSAQDLVQRFFVAADRRSYFRPHCHLTKSELAQLLRGQVDLLVFDAEGTVTARHSIEAGSAYETPQGTWHTLVAQQDGCCFLEVKQGPYDPATAVEFAPWAPAEGSDQAGACHEWLRTAQVGSRWSA